MKINKKSLLIISLIILSVFTLGVVSAADNANMANIDESSIVKPMTINEDSIQDTNLLSEGEPGANDPITVTIKDATSIIGSENNVGYDENITIEIEVNDNSFDLTQNKVELKIAGDHISDVNIDSTTKKGSYVIPSSTYDQGRYYVEATLVDVANQKVISGNNFFNVVPAEVTINVENIEAITGAGVKVPINITGKKDGKGVNGTAYVTIFYYTQSGVAKNMSKAVTIVNGTGTGTLDMSMLMGMMGGMMDGNNSAWNNMFNGSASWSEMMSGGQIIPSGPSGMPMTSTDVKFNYYYPVGNYTIRIEFLDNRNYNYGFNDTNLIVTYPDVLYYAQIVQTPEKAGDITAVFIMVMDKYGVPITNKVVSYDLDNKESGNITLNENGTATLFLMNVLNGNHKLFLSSNATGNITNDTFEFAISIPKADVALNMKDTSVVAIDTTLDGKSGKYFTVTLKDALGNILNNKTIQITLNAKKYNRTTDENGIAKVALDIAKANVYTCAVCYLGDDSYNAAFDMVKVTVKKQTPKLTVAKKTYKVKAKTKKLTATFKTSKGKAIKGKKITFKVNGKTYTGTTNAKGVATVKVNLAKKGSYTFKASFAGDNTYKAISKNAKLVLK